MRHAHALRILSLALLTIAAALAASLLPFGWLLRLLAALGVLGVALPVLETTLAKKWRYLVPSAAAMGLALVIMPRNSISMLVGAILPYILAKVCKTWTERFLVTICAGVIAGESLTGAGDALRLLFMGY